MLPPLEPVVVFCDTETGGDDPLLHPLIQWAGVAVDIADWTELGRLNVKLNGWKIEECTKEALRVNLYDAREWKDAIPPAQAVENITKFLKRFRVVEYFSKTTGSYKVARLAGHKAEFDYAFTKQLFEKHEKFLPASPQVLDTHQLALWRFWRKPVGERPDNFRLTTLAEWYGISVPSPHDALTDTVVLVEVCRALSEGRPRHPKSLAPF